MMNYLYNFVDWLFPAQPVTTKPTLSLSTSGLATHATPPKWIDLKATAYMGAFTRTGDNGPLIPYPEIERGAPVFERYNIARYERGSAAPLTQLKQ